jgi:hypothetical protein
VSDVRPAAETPSTTKKRTDKLLRSVLEMNSWVLFGLIALAFVLQAMYWNTNVLTEGVYYQTFGGHLPTEQMDRLLRLRRGSAWLSYAFIPLTMIVRIGFTALCLLIGAVLVEYELPFTKAFKIALAADVVFVADSYVKTGWLAATHVATVTQAASFTPLSLFSLVGPEHVAMWMAYPLQLANAFELLYWIVLALVLRAALQRPFGSMLKFVAGSYGFGFLVYVMAVMFLAVNVG